DTTQVGVIVPGATPPVTVNHDQGTATPHKGNKTLTREEMAGVIRQGRAVIVNHRVISRIEELPQDEDIERVVTTRHNDILDGLDRQIGELTARRTRLVAQIGSPTPDQETTRSTRQGENAQEPGQGAISPDGDALPREFPSVAALFEAGFRTKAAVAAATDDELLKIKGIGKPTLEQIRKALGQR
ncbi:MAG: helix-hairpin-helix domain-containing protein, partial [Blastocatellia bacterium]